MMKGKKMSEQIVNENKEIPNEKKWEYVTGTMMAIIVVLWAIAFLGLIPTDYNLFFFVLSIITGFYWFKEKKAWKQYLKINHDKELVRPWWLSWTAGVFPIVVTIFLLRGFFVEPFKVPTGSMIPNIMIGEVIITNKIYYDLKIPVIEKSIKKIREVKRGDVVVFRYPPSPTTYYVKRFVGLPGDVVEYNFVTKALQINHQEVTREKVGDFSTEGKNIEEYKEDLLGFKHSIWIEPAQHMAPNPSKINFPHIDQCQYTLEKMTCTVPKNYYFAMGDNRDNSADSRYWGFVPEENIVGKGQLIAYSPVDFHRIGWIK